jgi:hypothetical protein
VREEGRKREVSMVDSVSQSGSQAKLYKQEVTMTIGATIAKSPHIGYLDQNKSALEVQGTITQQDSTNYLRFNYRTGKSIQLNVSKDAGVRIQLMDASGNRVLADNGGTNNALKQAYVDLRNGNLNLKNGNYVFKVSYDKGVSKTKTLNYDLSLFSGTTYAAKYKTLAYPTTILYQLQAGGTVGYTGNATTASMLMSQQSGEDVSIIDYLA